MRDYSTLAVVNGSSIGGNTAEVVNSPAYALASGVVVGAPSNKSALGHCERETSR